jgi:hypothetical protein
MAASCLAQLLVELFFTGQRSSKRFKPLQSDFSQQHEIHEAGMLAPIDLCPLL